MSKSNSLERLRELDRSLVEAALKASAHAYAPYSGFAVGAAVRTTKGEVYTGANMENASYGLGICAEVAALTAANSAGDFQLEAIAIVGHKFTEPRDGSMAVTPCGRCRQLIFEASQIAGKDARILCCNGELTKIVETSISVLLPSAFGPDNLGLVKAWPAMRGELQESLLRLRHRLTAKVS